MPRFKYIAMDAKGTETEGVLDAENQSQVIATIRAKNLFPTKVSEMSSGGNSSQSKQQKKGQSVLAQVSQSKSSKSINIKLPSIFQKRVKPKNLMMFTRQLATLQDAGLPLLRGLRILLKQEPHPTLRQAATAIGESVESGSTFSEALAQHPKIFDELYVNMVKAGEAGGILEVVLARLAEFMEKAEKIKNKVKSAMVYPVVVLIVALAILTFLLISVIPKFEQIFKDLLQGEPLPPLTQFVISISRIVQTQYLYVIIGVAAFVITFKIWKKTATGAYMIDKFKIKAPLFGSLFLKTAIARFSRTLGTLLSSGVPVLQALNIVRDTTGNKVIGRAIQQVHDSVKEGDTMASPLEASGAFPDIVVSMVDVGEETGALPEMLIKVADTYDNEVDTAVAGLTSVLEPLMIVCLALIIGVIVIAMFVPLISIITKLSG